jgi:hypothetical protein
MLSAENFWVEKLFGNDGKTVEAEGKGSLYADLEMRLHDSLMQSMTTRNVRLVPQIIGCLFGWR